MLYKKNTEKELSTSLFQNPTSEYRGTPFWGWNCKLNKEELLWQIDVLHAMGFGGFHMHVRYGMDTPYLSDEFMDMIRSCVDKAKEKDMLAWLYDEDRWPSGYAGGLVTKDPQYRIRYLMMTTTPIEPMPFKFDPHGILREQNFARRTGCNNQLLATYDVVLDEAGCLASYRRLKEGEQAEGQLWYASIESPHCSPRYNGGTYVDTMSKAAIERYIEITHERYKSVVGDEFGKTIPSIFSDEPQTIAKQTLKFAKSTGDVAMPYTDDFEDTFQAAYGVSLLDHLPEVFWELPDGQVSQIRYFFHDHVAERFASAFADTLGAWCSKNGIHYTGHMMHEPTLESQTAFVGECMRQYRGFSLPGMDMLSTRRELNTAKQVQSAVHQQSSEGMMDELYGVTSWDCDFRGYKNYGDWQAAMGVTVRIPHLAWVSMAGEAKRDYPASINYQSPWYKEYSYVEDHYSRLNTALTRGKPVVKVGVVHPIESFWLHWGPEEQTATIREQLDKNFDSVTRWLVYGNIDFDFLCESTLPSLCKEGGAPLQVGQMAYDAIVVPACETLRSSTLQRLEAFRAAGGTLIFMGNAPTLVDALPSDAPKKLFDASTQIPFDRHALLNTLHPFRTVELRSTTGTLCDHLMYTMRQDGDVRWLFVANGTVPENKDISNKTSLFIKITGLYQVKLYDTITGEIKPVSYTQENGFTVVPAELYDYDSLLLHLTPSEEICQLPVEPDKVWQSLSLPHAVPFTLAEDNVLLLDLAQWQLDDGPMQEREEILRIDTTVRHSLGWHGWGGAADQPWYLPKEAPTHTLHLRYTFHSEITYANALLAVENPKTLKIRLNGKPVDTTPQGWYVDKAIETVALPAIQTGENILEVDMPYGERTAAEAMYLLGQFGVRVEGSCCVITELPKKLSFGSIVHQGLPFYSGKLTYHLETDTEAGVLRVRTPQYRAALLRVHVDGENEPVVYPPYIADFNVGAGHHKVDIDAYIPRTNGFGPVHCCNDTWGYQSPKTWRTVGDSWSYEYRFCPEGILVSPQLSFDK